MRRLIVRLTAAASLLAAFLSAAIGVLTGISWPVVVLRSTLALLIVVLVGGGFGLILMRTALRRYYEERRATSGDRQIRADR
jgi:hypothetical protein